MKILAEGAPGIGKSMLLKEIAFLWAKGDVLEDKDIVLLISLCNPDFNSVNSPKGMFLHCDNYKNEENAQLIADYFRNNSGKGLVILLDGLDENPKALDKGTFLYKLIAKGLLSKACVVVTSRPHATFDMQKHVSFRVVIIGFTMQRRHEFLTKNLEPGPAAALENYLKEHAVIDTLCHIPLNLTILVSLVTIRKQKLVDMPNTQTDLINTAVEMTISHNLHKMGFIIEKTSIDKIPEPYKTIFNKLCALAYRAMVDEKLTFTAEEIKTACYVDVKYDKLR